MTKKNSKEFGQIISRLIAKENLSRQEATEAFYQILDNKETDMHQGAFLSALTAKGETKEEIAAGWETIYALDTVKFTPKVTSPIVDNCGTGMDTLKTFNISTAASIVAAAAGINMAKHGARAITSSCGTVDMAENLGVHMECDPALVNESIEKVGIGMFNGMSPKVHPQALGHILSQISFGTVLNIAASLANPTLPKYAVRGVYSPELVRPVAEIMKEIGYKRALIIHGLNADSSKGMDEASVQNSTYVAELTETGEIKEYTLQPQDLGIPTYSDKEIMTSGDLTQETLSLLSILDNRKEGARRDIVAVNAALIIYLMNKTDSIKNGFKEAQDIISSGKALQKLEDWVQAQNPEPEKGLKKLNNWLEDLDLLQENASSY